MTHSKHRTVDRRQRHANAVAPAPIRAPCADPPPADDAPLNVRLGWQLRTARQARQRDIEDCAQALHLPARVLKQLEAGDYTGISDCVYLRNYLRCYGASVGLRREAIQAAIEQLAPMEKQPTLVSTGGVSRSHYLWHRFTTFGTYAVLTAVIVVPLVWLGLKGGLDRELTRLEPLNPAPVSAPSANNGGLATDPVKPAAQGLGEKPLMASLAPFSALDSVDADADADAVAAPTPAPPDPAVVTGSHTLSITLSMPSWVEVSTLGGKHLQYSLLPAGTHKLYHSAKPLQVSIGDTAGASVHVDGKRIDLGPYQHANVAHFRVVPKDGQAVIQPI